MAPLCVFLVVLYLSSTLAGKNDRDVELELLRELKDIVVESRDELKDLKEQLEQNEVNAQERADELSKQVEYLQGKLGGFENGGCTNESAEVVYVKVPTKVRHCHAPEPLYNGYIYGEQTTYGSNLTFRCDDQSTFEGAADTITCLETGEWSGPAPKCWRQCEVPELTNGMALGYKAGALFKHGDTLPLRCYNRYVANETPKPTICKNGTWTFIPVCVSGTCPKLDIEHSVVYPAPKLRSGGYDHGSKVNVSCKTTYVREGERSLICDKGSWSAPLPSCKAYCPHGKSIFIDYPRCKLHHDNYVTIHDISLEDCKEKCLEKQDPVCTGAAYYKRDKGICYLSSESSVTSLHAYTCYQYAENDFTFYRRVCLEDEETGPIVGVRNVKGTTFYYDQDLKNLYVYPERKATIALQCSNVKSVKSLYWQPNDKTDKGRVVRIHGKKLTLLFEGNTADVTGSHQCTREGHGLDTLPQGDFINIIEQGTRCTTPVAYPDHVEVLPDANEGTDNGHGKFPMGIVIAFKCSPPFKVVGSPWIQCQPDGQWSSSPPQCKKD